MEPGRSGACQNHRDIPKLPANLFESTQSFDSQVHQLQTGLEALRKRTEKSEMELKKLREFISSLGRHGGPFINQLIARVAQLELELEQLRKVPEASKGAHTPPRSPSPGILSLPASPDQPDLRESRFNRQFNETSKYIPHTPPRTSAGRIPPTPRPPFLRQASRHTAAVKPAAVDLKRPRDRTEFGCEGERKESFAVPDEHIARSIKRSRRTDSMKVGNPKTDPRRQGDTLAV